MKAYDVDKCRGLILNFIDNQEIIVNDREGPRFFSRHQRGQFIAAMKCIEVDFIQTNKELKKGEKAEIKSLFSLFYKAWGGQLPVKKTHTLSNHEITIAERIFIKLNGLMEANKYSLKAYPFLNDYIKQFPVRQVYSYNINDNHGPSIEASMNKSWDYLSEKNTYLDISEAINQAKDKVVLLMAPKDDEFEFIDFENGDTNEIFYNDIDFDNSETTEIITPLKKAYQLPLDIGQILDSNSDSLLAEAKAKGYKVLSVLKANEVKQSDVFTIINHGTTNTQANMNPNESEVSVLSIVANLLKEEGDMIGNTYMINDGPGSIGDPDLMLSIVNPETNSLITLELPSALPDIARRGFGAITGFGLNEISASTLKRLHWLDALNKLPKKLVLLGFSRGGAQNHYLANEVAREFDERMTIDMFSIDPVPGGLDILFTDNYMLPKIVTSAVITIAANEKRALFQAITPNWLKLEGDTDLTYITLPGQHDEQRKVSFDSGRFIAHELAEFLLKNNVIEENHKIYGFFKIHDIARNALLKDLQMAQSNPLVYKNTSGKAAVDISESWFMKKFNPLMWRDSSVSNREGRIPIGKPTQIKGHSGGNSRVLRPHYKGKTTSLKPACHDMAVAGNNANCLHVMIQQASRMQSNPVGGTDQLAGLSTADSVIKIFSAAII